MDKHGEFMVKNELTYGRGYVYSLQYHLVWCTKYRKKVLRDGIDTECREMLEEMAGEYKFTITAMEVMPDHIRREGCSSGTRSSGRSCGEGTCGTRPTVR